MYHLQTSPGRTAMVDGKEHLFFSGYSYLGMGHVPEFTELVKEGIDKYGLLHPSSRISNTVLDLFEEFESKLSEITGCEETVSFSSGYVAGRAIVDHTSKDETLCFTAPDTHPAIKCSATQLPDEWKTYFIEKVNQSINDTFTLLVDSVSPLKATVTNYSFLQSIHPDKKIICIVDDSHGFGLAGTEVKGVHKALPVLQNVEFILSYSLSKAYHLQGGGISCSKETAEALRLSTFYTGSTPVSPAFIYAFLNGQLLYHMQQKKLQDNINLFISLIKDVPGILSHPDLPVFILPTVDHTIFEKYNIIISSFAYPNATGKRINRVVLNALHTEDDLKKIADIIHSIA